MRLSVRMTGIPTRVFNMSIVSQSQSDSTTSYNKGYKISGQNGQTVWCHSTQHLTVVVHKTKIQWRGNYKHDYLFTVAESVRLQHLLYGVTLLGYDLGFAKNRCGDRLNKNSGNS